MYITDKFVVNFLLFENYRAYSMAEGNTLHPYRLLKGPLLSIHVYIFEINFEL